MAGGNVGRGRRAGVSLLGGGLTRTQLQTATTSRCCPGFKTALRGYPYLVIYVQAEIVYHLCTMMQWSKSYKVICFESMDAAIEQSVKAPAQA